MTNLRKGFSLAGPGPTQVSDGIGVNGAIYPLDPTTLDANDYRQPSVRERMMSGPEGSTWVKLWVNFNWLLQDFNYQAGTTQYGDVWEWLNHSPYNSYAIQRLDRQVAAANLDGKRVVITLYQSLPPWCIAAPPGTVDPLGRPYTQGYPNPTSGQPWSWLLAYLFARYRAGAAVNPTGPGRTGTNQYGNPYGAWAYMIEFTNEPNGLCWPQFNGSSQSYACVVSLMFKTAEECSYFWAGGGAPYVLGPGTVDADAPGSTNVVDWRDFTTNVVNSLQGWQPRTYVGWSLHNYSDVKEHHDGYKARSVIQLLYANGWKGGTDGNIFITESGLNMAARIDVRTRDANGAAETDQASFNHDTYASMYATPQAYCWLNHIVNDKAGADFVSGVRRNWNSATHSPGAERPYSTIWQYLGSTA